MRLRHKIDQLDSRLTELVMRLDQELVGPIQNMTEAALTEMPASWLRANQLGIRLLDAYQSFHRYSTRREFDLLATHTILIQPVSPEGFTLADVRGNQLGYATDLAGLKRILPELVSDMDEYYQSAE